MLGDCGVREVSTLHRQVSTFTLHYTSVSYSHSRPTTQCHPTAQEINPFKVGESTTYALDTVLFLLLQRRRLKTHLHANDGVDEEE